MHAVRGRSAVGAVVLAAVISALMLALAPAPPAGAGTGCTSGRDCTTRTPTYADKAVLLSRPLTRDWWMTANDLLCRDWVAPTLQYSTQRPQPGYGDGYAVVMLQALLRKSVAPGLRVDGRFLSATVSAVKDWQRAYGRRYGIPVTGVVRTSMWSRLRNSHCH